MISAISAPSFVDYFLLKGLCKISAEQLLPRSRAEPVRRLGEALGGWWRCERFKHKTGVRRKCVEANGMETTSHYCSFFRRLLMITVVYIYIWNTFETSMLVSLWKLFPRAFQYIPFLLGVGIDLGQTFLLDQATDKSKRLIEPTRLERPLFCVSGTVIPPPFLPCPWSVALQVRPSKGNDKIN